MNIINDFIVYKNDKSIVYIREDSQPNKKSGKLPKFIVYKDYDDLFWGRVRYLKLGVIKFDGGWRQFVFFPEPDTKWSADCILKINNFLLLVNAEWKKGLKKC